MSLDHSEGSVDLEILVDLEQRFYDAGYQDGLEHGKIHGRIEGMELGKQKGFEMWEELGFYEGFATLWKTISGLEEKRDSRALHNVKILLDLIARFPSENPSHSDSADLDIMKLLGQIRARYKMLCSTLGVKPSLRTSQTDTQTSADIADEETLETGPSKKNKVWLIETTRESGGVDYSF